MDLPPFPLPFPAVVNYKLLILTLLELYWNHTSAWVFSCNEKCMKLPYDLYCPSTKASNVDYVCPYILCKKICSTKELLLNHLKATQHHAFEETDMISIEDDMHEDEEETLDIADGPCLIPNIEKYLEQTSEIIYK